MLMTVLHAARVAKKKVNLRAFEVHTHTHIHIHTYSYTHTHTHAHSYTQTHTMRLIEVLCVAQESTKD
jgi:hypothetical protein